MRKKMKSYLQRSESFDNPTAKRLLILMDEKKTNLCIAADVVLKQDLLLIADALGPYICCLKTHIDILSDFDQDLVNQLLTLSQKHRFLIFEDRKFADIGNTVKLQYSSGIYKIASWSDITNAHPIPGENIVTGLAQIGLPLGRGLLLLAEMSTKGTLATGEYSQKTLDMARNNKDFVIGFIGQNRLENSDEDFIYMTPGVNLGVKGDKLGQQYRTPREVVFKAELDSIIVGRGIYESMEREKMVEKAVEYRDAGWSAYLERCEA